MPDMLPTYHSTSDRIWGESQIADGATSLAETSSITSIDAWADRKWLLEVAGEAVGLTAVRLPANSVTADTRLALLAGHRTAENALALAEAALRLGREAGRARVSLSVAGRSEWATGAAVAVGFEKQGAYLRMERSLDGLQPARAVAGIAVRAIAIDEQPAVLMALNQAWATTEGFRPIRPHQLAGDLEGDRHGFLLAVDEASGAIAGTAHAMLDPGARLPDGGWRGWVSNVTTVPSYRGRGIARLMLTRALMQLRERGATVARLGVAEASDGAIGLYESMGFETVGRSAWYLRTL